MRSIIKNRYNRKGLKTGLWEWYHDNGQLHWKCSYKNGLEEGVYEEYYEYGQLYSKYFYKNGLREGEN